MPGSIAVTFEREPSFFQAAKLSGNFHQICVARDRGRIIGIVLDLRSRDLATAIEQVLALGATRWEAVTTAVLPYARSGIVGAVILGLGRALGETMAVTMLIGNRHEIAASLFAPGYTMAAAIANENTTAGPA